MVPRYSAYVAFMLVIAPLSAVWAETPEEEVIVTTADVFRREDELARFLVASSIFGCCLNEAKKDSLLGWKGPDTRILIDSFEYAIAMEHRKSFKEQFGAWTPWYAYSIGFGVSMHLETRYIAQPRISFRLPNQQEPIIFIKPLSKRPFEIRFRFYNLPLIEE